MPLAVGTRLGPYEVVAAIGAGGMGEVYRATDTRLDRTVAIKVLNPTLAADPQFHDRFDREARIISQLTHPNICTLYDVGRHEGSAYLVLEFLEGETLAARLGRFKDRPLPPGETLSIAIQIADALAMAHRAGIVHRDLKPGNVMLTKSGAKLLDFGLAKPGSALTGPPQGGPHVQDSLVRGVRLQPDLTAAPTLTSPLTLAGSILGTLLYMSPEVLQGAEADARSDLFAFGAMLYEMLSGRKTFSGKTQVGVMAAILEHDPPALSSLQPATPRALDRLVRKCLEKDPDRRWQSARDVHGELEWIAETLSEPAPGISHPASSTPHPARSTFPRVMWAATVLLPIVAAAVMWVALHRAPETPQPVRFAIVPPPAQPLSIQGFSRDIAITPDGRNIVYRIGAAGATGAQLGVRSLDQLDARVLAGISGVRSPFISPDGHWIGFFGAAGGELKKVSILGGPPITLCRYNGNQFGVSWGPDDVIIFATSDRTTGLLSVPAGGGDPKVVTKPDAAHGESDHLLPSVLPGGGAVLFTITMAGQPIENSQIAVLDLKTGQRKTLIRGGSDAKYVETGHLIYAAAGTLRAVRFDLGRLEVTSDPVPVVEQVTMSGTTGEADFALSRNGTLVYVPGTVGGGATRSLVWVNRQGREEPIKAAPRAYLLPRISPDGTRVALDIRDQENDIWVWDLKRETLTRVTLDPGLDSFPVWTPDGRRIIFSSSRGGVQNLYWQAADNTGTIERLTTSTNVQNPYSISPDGTRVLFGEFASKTGNDIGLLALAGPSPAPSTVANAGQSPGPVPAGRHTEPLIQTTFNETNAEISPDGRWVAYQSNESGMSQVYVRPFPKVDGGHWQVSTNGGTRPVWARNGRELFYLDGSNRLSVVPVQTAGPMFSAGKPTKLLDIPYFVGNNARTYDVSPDGQRFLMIKDASTDQNSTATPASMVVVEHWVEELKQRLPAK